MSVEPAARFFVNHGIVSGRTDMEHLLRPLLKQTVMYRYVRAGQVVSHGTGWVERIVAGQPGVSSFFTPLSICINVDSWEHLEFDTRPDQLLSYVLVQGDERVTIEFAAMVHGGDDTPVQESLRLDPMSQYIQMELAGMGVDVATSEPAAPRSSGPETPAAGDPDALPPEAS
ncbi:MAG: hypothetical protein KF809_12440 [Chloroflexi bacterium]|nr:hypothetical protein [Chloroflexota bacterium]